MTSRRALLLGAMGAAAASLAACGTDATQVTPSPTPSPSTPPSPSPTPSPSPKPAVTWPLNGRVVKNKELLDRPAIAAKVPNLKNENPQWGLMDADIVFCQVNGHAYTRLVPVFHSKYPEAVGPIRSLRPVDIPLLSPMSPVVANTGAAEWVRNYVDAHDDNFERMTYLDWRGTGAYSVDQDRLYRLDGKTYYDRAIQAHPKQMAQLATRMTEKPKPYFTFAPDAEGASTAEAKKSATSIAVPYGNGHRYDMGYALDDDGHYVRSQPWGSHVLADGTQVWANAVLIIEAAWEMAKIWEGSGAADPVIDIIDAKGEFHYCHGGKVVSGTWKKGAIDKRFSFVVKGGEKLKFAPGRTFVEMPSPSADLIIA